MKKDVDVLENYELGNATDLNFFKILEILNEIKEHEAVESKNITKTYVNSLFTPILSYIIDYLNENEEKKGIIGKSKIKQLNVVYTILNESIYDLFLIKIKGKILDSDNQINYDINFDDENYLISHIKNEKILDLEKVKKIVSFDEEAEDIESLKMLFMIKKKKLFQVLD